MRHRLRADPDAAARYSQLKHDLAAQHRDDRAGYTAAKTRFLASLIPAAEQPGGVVPPVQRVRAVLITPAGRLLAIRRTKPGQPPHWVLPGGGIEPAEHRLPHNRPDQPRRGPARSDRDLGRSADMKASSTAAANEARRRDTETKVDNVRAALQRMLKAKEPINFRAVASTADVSRTFLYDNTAARTLVTEAIGTVGVRRNQRHASSSTNTAAWRERALNAEHTLQTAAAEIQAQRTQIGRLLGTLRELDSELPPDAMQGIHSDNLDLKQQVEKLTAANVKLTQKLKASRENGRFRDRRIAELEAI